MHSSELTQFKSFPFLRDEFFLQILAQFDGPRNSESFGEFLFKAQCAYYQRYIDSSFNVGTLLAASSAAPPQCPFSRAKAGGNRMKFIVDGTVLLSKMSLLHYGRISVSAVNSFVSPNFQIMTLDSRCSAQDASFYMDQTFEIEADEFKSAPLIILSEKTSFRFKSYGNEIIKALSHVKATFTAADIRCLLNENFKIFVFPQESISEVLNILIYAKASNVPLRAALKSVAQSNAPSRLEPYRELLSPQYIHENPDLFA